MRSRLSSLRRPKPMNSYSLKLVPWPTPTSSRPPERLSSSASSVASRIGWRSASWSTAKPMRIRDVRAATALANGIGSQ